MITTESQTSEQLSQLATLRLQYDNTHLNNLRDMTETEYQIDRLERDLKRKRPLLATGGTTQGAIDDLEAELTRDRAESRDGPRSAADRRGVQEDADR